MNHFHNSCALDKIAAQKKAKEEQFELSIFGKNSRPITNQLLVTANVTEWSSAKLATQKSQVLGDCNYQC